MLHTTLDRVVDLLSPDSRMAANYDAFLLGLTGDSPVSIAADERDPDGCVRVWYENDRRGYRYQDNRS